MSGARRRRRPAAGGEAEAALAARWAAEWLACLAPRLAPCLALFLALPGAPLSAASFPAASGRGGAVASGERQASEAGLAVLARGGNAVDGAVATALALAVVHPEAGNLGGGGFAVVRIGDELTTLDFRETAPAAASRDMYLDEAGQPIPDASLVGPLAAGVPGSPAGLHALHARFGALPWAEVVAPALALARDGFPLSGRTRRSILEERELLARFPETARVWLPGGEPPPPDARIVLPELAATLAAYAERGPAGITEGPVAAAIEAASTRYGGRLTTADLAAYRPVWREPLVFDAFGWRLAAMDLPSSGGILMAATLGILERLRWPERPRFGAERAHLLAEAWRRAFADRFLLGDPSTTRATAAELLAAERLDRRAATVTDRATPSSGVAAAEAAAIEGVAVESRDTTHLSVIDAAGNAVALTTTLNGTFGCGLVVPGAGFFLNNEMDDFATAPGRPNLFGLVQGEANAVAPGKRMLSSMSPTIAWKGEELVALGGRGGSRIPTATLQVLLNLLVDGDPLQAAIDRPRLHHQWLPDELQIEEDSLAPETRAELERRGHAIAEAPFSAKVNVARRHPSGRLEAAGDPRGPAAGGVVVPVAGEVD